MILVLMGVTGVGKTTIGTLLSARTGWKFEDAEDYHSEEKRRKMAAGIPLTDPDRGAWLDALHERMLQYRKIRQSAILACSALKQQYRELLASDRQSKNSARPAWAQQVTNWSMMPTRAPTNSFSALRHNLASSTRSVTSPELSSSAKAVATSIAADELSPAPIRTSPRIKRFAPCRRHPARTRITATPWT